MKKRAGFSALFFMQEELFLVFNVFVSPYFEQPIGVARND
jgi:hypothetical protein